MSIGTIFKGDITDAIGELDRFVPVALTDQELIVRAGEWASAHKRAEEAKSSLESIQGSLKSQIKKSELEASALARIVGERKEHREVKCYEVLDGNMVQIVRSDTFEVVDYRTATSTDKQKPLFFFGNAKPEEQVEVEPIPPDEEVMVDVATQVDESSAAQPEEDHAEQPEQEGTQANPDYSADPTRYF